jgi:hypothetical protein
MIDVHLVDRKALEARSPIEVSMYLRARKWESRLRTVTSVQWVKTVDGDEFEAMQPIESSIRDYPSRVHDVIETLAIVEGRSELDVLNDISNVSTDVHLVRTFPTDVAAGKIGLDDGVQAYESLRSLIIAAAYSVSVEKPRAVQPARKPNELLRFLREVQIGPSAEGSFVLSVHTPIPPRLTNGQASLFEGQSFDDTASLEPFERRVSLRIYDAVSAANAAANAALVDPDALNAFTGAINRGISANLCEALVGLGGEGGHSFEISLLPAPSRPINRSLMPVHFRRDHLPVLAAAAQELRERMPEEDVLVTGNVVRLHREGFASGEVSIAGIVEGEDRLRRIWLNLESEIYQEASRAHMEMLTVSVRGDLVRRGTRSYLVNPNGFRLLPEREDL